MKTRAIRMAKQGAPDVLILQDVDLGPPGPGQVLVRQTAIGLNFLDVYHRSGAYPLPVPSGVGSEGAGVVEAVGEGVTALKPGDRVAYQGGEIGSYAAHRVMPVARLVKLPDAVSDDVAAAIMLKGMTVEYLLDRCVPLKAGDFALTYAAAGGVGLLMGQWAKARGIKLIGVAAGAEKCALARASGYFAVLDRKTDDIVARVKDMTGGKGVPAVFDSVGKDTFETTLDCLAPRGFFVSFGATTGAPPPVEAGVLQKRGSLYFTRPTLVT
jgi:NADPH2:quinone reductase